MKNSNRFYQCQLGPHNDRSSSYSHSSFFGKASSSLAKAFAKPHSFSSALLMVSALSFFANVTFLFFFAYDVSGSIAKNFSENPAFVDRFGEIFLGSDDAASAQGIIGPGEGKYHLIEDAAVLKVNAESFIAADVDTGEIIMEKNADMLLPMASVTKLMTAIVAHENIDVRHVAVVSKNSFDTYGSEGGLAAGEKIFVGDLIYPLLMESSNDAAEVLADDFGREAFMALLNGKAEEFGMINTSYEDPSGLSPGNVTTSRDLLHLALELRKDYPELLDVTRVKEYAIGSHTWENKNKFLSYPNFLGGKNGFINESKQTTVSFFKVNFRGDDPESDASEHTVALIILKTADRDDDASNILSYISRNVRIDQGQPAE